MRSVSEIYSEAVAVRNNYLQITELNSGRSNSKLSMLNLLTYVVAVCIHTYEAVLDAFQVRIAQILSGRINGTPEWYVMMSKKFQYNPVTMAGDDLLFDEDTMKLKYTAVDTNKRIVQKAAWELDSETGTLTLKVCKENTNSDEVASGTPFTLLNPYEMTAFKEYISRIKFVGASVESVSLPGDIMTIVAPAESPIFYDDSYITEQQAMENIRKALIAYVKNLEFNDMIYYQTVLDVIRKTEYISDIGTNISIMMSSYDELAKAYKAPVAVQGRIRLTSGYLRLLDEDGKSVLTPERITLVPYSQMDSYYASLQP